MKLDFFLRESIIAKARALYMPSYTNSISIALSLYLKNNASEHEKIPLLISSAKVPKSWIDQIGRPACPDCARPLLLRAIYEPKGVNNIHGYQTCWECLNCGHESYSLKSISDRLLDLNKFTGGLKHGKS